MLNKLLSGDYPRSRILSGMLLVTLFLTAFLPIIVEVFGIVEGRQMVINSGVKICVFLLLAASYDMLLGYTAVISFAHTVFFAIGAYAVAIVLTQMENPGWGALIAAVIIGIVVSATVALIIALVGLRVRTLFFTMITLAVAEGFGFLLFKLSSFTGGEEGLNFDNLIPEILQQKYMLIDSGLKLSESGIRYAAYYLIFFATIALFWFMLRMVNSPLGKVLQAIRENDFRTEAIGFKPVIYRMIVIVTACSIATLAGSLYAIWLKSAVPNTYVSLVIMITILIMVVIGGMGTIYGSVIGAVIMILMENYLNAGIRSVLGDGFHYLNKGGEVVMDGTAVVLEKGIVYGDKLDAAAAAKMDLSTVPVLYELVSAERWLMYLGIMYVLCVYFFNIGIVGKLRVMAFEKLLKKQQA